MQRKVPGQNLGECQIGLGKAGRNINDNGLQLVMEGVLEPGKGWFMNVENGIKMIDQNVMVKHITCGTQVTAEKYLNFTTISGAKEVRSQT